MKEEVKNFLEKTFKEIQNSLSNDVYEDGDFIVKDGVLEIAIGRDILEPIEENVRYMLSDKLLSLFGDDFEGEVDENDYFEFDWYSNYFQPSSVTFGSEICFCITVYYIVVKAKIEKLEELFNEN